jgi:hypothetical protein
LFAVTDQCYILPLIITAVENVDKDYYKVTTTLVNNTSNHAKAHHNAHFKTMYYYKGELEKQSVFSDEFKANIYAFKNLDEVEIKLNAQLTTINDRKSAINSVIKELAL